MNTESKGMLTNEHDLKGISRTPYKAKGEVRPLSPTSPELPQL